MLDLNEIRENYKRYDDIKIRRVAKSESRGLREEVVEILIEELHHRGFENSLIEWIQAERRILSPSELQNLKAKVKNSVCTCCQRNRNLRGYHFVTKTGIVASTHTTEYKLILCKDCGDQKRMRSTIHSIALGWISPVSLISYPFLLAEKIKIHLKEDSLSEKIIERFITGNIGTITTNNESTEIFKKLLEAQNTLYESSISQ